MCMVHATDLIYFIQVPGFKETIVKEGGGGKCTYSASQVKRKIQEV